MKSSPSKLGPIADAIRKSKREVVDPEQYTRSARGILNAAKRESPDHLGAYFDQAISVCDYIVSNLEA